MNTKRLATVFLVTVGVVLVPGVANAATSTTVTPSTTTVDPIFVLAVGTTVTATDGSTDTSASSVTDVSTPDPAGGVQSDKDADKAAKQAAETAKRAAHDAEEAAKRAQHDADEAAKKAGKGPKGQVKNDTTLTSSTMSWTGDPSLFDGQGRKFG